MEPPADVASGTINVVGKLAEDCAAYVLLSNATTLDLNFVRWDCVDAALESAENQTRAD